MVQQEDTHVSVTQLVVFASTLLWQERTSHCECVCDVGANGSMQGGVNCFEIQVGKIQQTFLLCLQMEVLGQYGGL